MIIFNKNKFLIVLCLIFGCFLGQVQAEVAHYRYTNLSDKVPTSSNSSLFSFFDVSGINDQGQVAGNIVVCDDLSCKQSVGIYQNGRTQALSNVDAFSGPINERGVVGGDVILDADFHIQAALFRKTGAKLIPPQPNEISSTLLALNDENVTLVGSFDEFFNEELYLYEKRKSTKIDFGAGISNPFFLALNNHSLISGTSNDLRGNFRAFRFDPKTGLSEVLNPLPTEPLSWGLGINTKGEVLGYSFINGHLERIGIWNRRGEFQIYFVEGTDAFPTISNVLRFNDKNQIVITSISSPANERFAVSYLVPKPGVRLNIVDLVVNKNDIPADAKFSEIRGINNHGDMVGVDFFGSGSFLLQRLDDDEIDAFANSVTKPAASLLSPEVSTAKKSRVKAFYRNKLSRPLLKKSFL